MTDHLMHTYARVGVSFVRGQGAWLYDSQDNRYLDAVSGIGVCSLGHAHGELAEAIADQAATLLHAANLGHIPAQERLADQLAEISGMQRVFFCNSGAEANECAIKIARVMGHERGLDAPEIIVAEGSFHGRTLACLSASGSRKVQAGFEPLVGGFLRVPFDDIAAIEEIANRRNKVVAVMLEPIQGEGGVRVPQAGYLIKVRELCDRHNWLLMLDEVQSGMGKTGTWFAWQHDDAKPDVMTLAKALGNGLPIGACIANGPAADALKPGKHGSTYGGGPLVCRVGSKVIEIMQRDGLLDKAKETGRYLRHQLRQALAEHPNVAQVRGHGLMIGIELIEPRPDLVAAALDKGVLINVTQEKVVRLLPPLIIDQEQADTICAVVVEVLNAAG